MWAIRVLIGPQAGQIFQLTEGRNVLGRSPSCTIPLAGQGVSKEHVEILVAGDLVTLKDLGSRNGTFVNGVRVHTHTVKAGDKVKLFEVVFDILPAKMLEPTPQANPWPQPPPTPPPLHPQYPLPPPDAPRKHRPPPVRVESNFFDDVVMPGIYKLTEVFEYRFVIGTFVFLFVLLTTFLAMIPMVVILSESVKIESTRRALTIARQMAAANYQAVLQNNPGTFTTQQAELEEGVKSAVLIAQGDGRIIAPASKAGGNLQLSFIDKARRETRETTTLVDIKTIGAAVPISAYSAELGGAVVKAHAVILYDLGSIAIDDQRILSLFIQVLFIGIILGLILYALLFKLIEFPHSTLNRGIDRAIRKKDDRLNIPLHFETFQNLLSNVNTLLSRAIHGNIETNQGFTASPDDQLIQLTHLITTPSLLLNKDQHILYANEHFLIMFSTALDLIRNQTVDVLPDQALQKTIQDLLARTSLRESSMASNQLSFPNGETHEISCQALYNSGNQPEHYFIIFKKIKGADE